MKVSSLYVMDSYSDGIDLYALALGYNFKCLTVSSEFSGCVQVFEDNLNRFFNTFNLGLHHTQGRIRSAILYQYIANDRYREYFCRESLGFKVSYLFNRSN